MPHQKAGTREALRVALTRADRVAHGAHRGHSNLGIDVARLRSGREGLVGVGNAGIRGSPVGNVGVRRARRHRRSGCSRSRGLNPGGRIGRARSLNGRLLKRLGGLHEAGGAVSVRQQAGVGASGGEHLGGVLCIVRVRARGRRTGGRNRLGRRDRLGIGELGRAVRDGLGGEGQGRGIIAGLERAGCLRIAHRAARDGFVRVPSIAHKPLHTSFRTFSLMALPRGGPPGGEDPQAFARVECGHRADRVTTSLSQVKL